MYYLCCGGCLDHSVFCAWPGHILSLFLWCGLGVCGPSLFCPTDRFGLRVPEGFCGDGPLRVYVDDYYRMRSSNDLNPDKVVDLSSLGVVVHRITMPGELCLVT